MEIKSNEHLSQKSNGKLEEKVKLIVSKVMSTSGESLSDRFAQVSNIVTTLTPEEKTLFIRNINALYDTDPYAALGFTLYGKLSGLENRVKGQLTSSDNQQRRSLAIEICGDQKLIGLYQNLQNISNFSNSENEKSCALISMFKINYKRTLPLIMKYLSTSSNYQRRFIVYNLLKSAIDSKDVIKKLKESLLSLPNGEELYSFTYRKLRIMGRV